MPKPSDEKPKSKKAEGGKAKSGKKTEPKAATKPPAPPKPAFTKKNQQPQVSEFAARLPLPVGRKLEAVRAFLRKQKSVTEELYFYGPRSGWGLRYLAGGTPLCALFIFGERPLAILSVDAKVAEAVDWDALSEVAQRARRNAHGSPTLSWLDLPLDGSGAADLKILVRAKLASADGTDAEGESDSVDQDDEQDADE